MHLAVPQPQFSLFPRLSGALKTPRRDRPHDQCPPSCRKYVKFSKSRRLTQYGRFRCQPNQTSGRMRNIFPEVISQHAVLLRQLPDTEQRSRQRRQARNDPKTRRNDGGFMETTNPASSMKGAVFAPQRSTHHDPAQWS